MLTFRAPRTQERIYLKDLSKFLDTGTARIRKWAKKNRLWHAGDVKREPDWVTAQGAMRIIAHIRAWQEQHYQRGHRAYHERLEYVRRHARKRLQSQGPEPMLSPSGGPQQRA